MLGRWDPRNAVLVEDGDLAAWGGGGGGGKADGGLGRRKVHKLAL